MTYKWTLEECKAQVGKGWADLITRCYEACQTSEDISIMQIKEKYGGLRFYIYGADDWVYDVIMKAEDESYTICEYCGEPGKPRDLSWIKTLCDDCYENKILDDFGYQKGKLVKEEK
jgi:hypothetical protein